MDDDDKKRRGVDDDGSGDTSILGSSLCVLTATYRTKATKVWSIYSLHMVELWTRLGRAFGSQYSEKSNFYSCMIRVPQQCRKPPTSPEPSHEPIRTKYDHVLRHLILAFMF